VCCTEVPPFEKAKRTPLFGVLPELPKRLLQGPRTSDLELIVHEFLESFLLVSFPRVRILEPKIFSLHEGIASRLREYFVLSLAYRIDRSPEVFRNMELVVHDGGIRSEYRSQCVHEGLPHIHGARLDYPALILRYTDSPTYWTILRAQWNKGQEVTTKSMEAVRDRLPFPLSMVHPDTGSEFINHTLKRWCDEAGIKMTRSEPGKKNDNMHVEERNGHVVRDELGYTRLDVPDVIDAMNAFYEVLCLYRNHFIPVRRTLSKVRIGSKYKRTYEKVAKTPYRRVLKHSSVSAEVREKLRVEHTTLNPLLLKRTLDTLRKKIFIKNRPPRPTESSGLG